MGRIKYKRHHEQYDSGVENLLKDGKSSDGKILRFGPDFHPPSIYAGTVLEKNEKLW